MIVKHILLLCKKCMSWQSYENETELTPLLRFEDFGLEYEDDKTNDNLTMVSREICFQNTTSTKAKDRFLNEILTTAHPNDYLVSPRILKNTEVKGQFGCCGMVGDLDADAPYNVFCLNGHPIGIETSDCIVDVHYTRIPAENVEVLMFENKQDG